MEFIDYKKLVQSIQVGKKLPDAIYLHQSLLKELPISLNEYLTNIISRPLKSHLAAKLSCLLVTRI